MKKGPYLLATVFLLTMVVIQSCNKDEDTTPVVTCQDDPATWAALAVDSMEVDTRGDCNEARMEYDTAFQYFAQYYINGNYLVTAASAYHLYDDTTYLGRFSTEVAFFAPDSIVQLTISGGDTLRRVDLQTMCYLLQTGRIVFFVTEMEQDGLNGGNFKYRSPDSTLYSMVPNSNISEMNVLSNEGLQTVTVGNDSITACICQVGFDVTLQDGPGNNQLVIDGLARLPFK